MIEFSDVVADWVRDIRKYEPKIAHMPVEVTLARSSGCGPIKTGQSLSDVVESLETLIPLLKGKLVGFKGVSNFPNSSIYYLEPERLIFDEAHRHLLATEISFEESTFAYNPHISLKGFTPPTDKEIDDLLNEQVPDGEYPMHKLSVIEMNGMIPSGLWSTEI